MVFKILIKYCRRYRSSGQGFTIVEVLIAMAILSVGLLAVGTMQITSIKGNKIAMDITEASCLAESKLEELMSIPFDHADVSDTNADGASGLDALTVDMADYSAPSSNGRYTLFWNVADDFPHNNTKTIKIIVVWSNTGQSKNISISCIRAS
jgi:type IV pilus assembly protein PilV